MLGGSSIVFGDNVPGFKQNGDGMLDAFAGIASTPFVSLPVKCGFWGRSRERARANDHDYNSK
ncbi:hypothetical protein KCP76_19660 [Salmonella enterica subsp. enterica serovar Weltevreden]|nr:hypothetical protein KCP76_19660 [Salmonella enterica subsp. enterica serovar Weltevreden]